MELQKAIENLKEILERGSMIDDHDDNQAIKLGIEALKLIEAWRKALPLDNPQLLPGETKGG